jgi:hypothetical protein
MFKYGKYVIRRLSKRLSSCNFSKLKCILSVVEPSEHISQF